MLVCSRLHTFSEVPHFRILVCGGDGTVGWVLGVLEAIRHKLACPEPAIGIIPLGTGEWPTQPQIRRDTLLTVVIPVVI